MRLGTRPPSLRYERSENLPRLNSQPPHLGENGFQRRRIEAQRKTVGLAKAGRPTKIGVSKTPVITLAEIGVDKNLDQSFLTLSAASQPAQSPSRYASGPVWSE